MSAPLDRAFLRRCELFESQPDEILDAIIAQGRLVEYGPGATVFRRGERGDSLTIIRSGVLAVQAPEAESSGGPVVAYLGPGEFLGELALLTGSPRSATVTAPERASVLFLDRTVFSDLMTSFPDFVRNLCVVLARRLESLLLRAPRNSAKELQGDLRFFDLATVIQTLVAAQQTGALVITQAEAGTRVAEIVFWRGEVWRARCRNLSGDEAVFQLFLHPIQGAFSFDSRPVREDERSADLTLPAFNLLMESARLHDELEELKRTLPDPEAPLGANAAALSWSDDATLELAAAVWSRLKRGTTLAELEREIPRCSYTVYKTVAFMRDAGFLREAGESVAGEPAAR